MTLSARRWPAKTREPVLAASSAGLLAALMSRPVAADDVNPGAGPTSA